MFECIYFSLLNFLVKCYRKNVYYINVMYTFVDIPTSNLARQNAKKIISVGQFVKHVICHNWILWLNGCLHSCYFLWECIQRVVSLEIVCGKVLSSQETSALCTWHTYNSGQILLTRTFTNMNKRIVLRKMTNYSNITQLNKWQGCSRVINVFVCGSVLRGNIVQFFRFHTIRSFWG